MPTTYVLQVWFLDKKSLVCFDISSAVDLLCLSRAYGSGKEDGPPCDVPGFENTRMKLLRHVSFVDCPVR